MLHHRPVTVNLNGGSVLKCKAQSFADESRNVLWNKMLDSAERLALPLKNNLCLVFACEGLISTVWAELWSGCWKATWAAAIPIDNPTILTTRQVVLPAGHADVLLTIPSPSKAKKENQWNPKFWLRWWKGCVLSDPSICPQRMFLLEPAGCALFGLRLFVVEHFPHFPTSYSCWTASGVGVVGHFLILQCKEHFKRDKHVWDKSLQHLCCACFNFPRGPEPWGQMSDLGISVRHTGWLPNSGTSVSNCSLAVVSFLLLLHRFSFLIFSLMCASSFRSKFSFPVFSVLLLPSVQEFRGGEPGNSERIQSALR